MAANKPVAKSNIVLDVKPWDDETDMAEVERKVRSIEADGLLWGAGKIFNLESSFKVNLDYFCSEIGRYRLWN